MFNQINIQINQTVNLKKMKKTKDQQQYNPCSAKEPNKINSRKFISMLKQVKKGLALKKCQTISANSLKNNKVPRKEILPTSKKIIIINNSIHLYHLLKIQKMNIQAN